MSYAPCPVCNKMLLKSSIRGHLRDVHNFSAEQVEELKHEQKKKELEHSGKNMETCSDCGRVFETIKGLQMHKKSKHSNIASPPSEETEEDSLKQCCLCGYEFSTQKELAVHCGETHSEDGAEGRPQDYSVHDVRFETLDKYKDWEQRMCEMHCTSLFCRSSKNDGRVMLMRCNRSGEKIPAGERRIRKSKKTTQICSAFINVMIGEDRSVHAIGCFGHIGHELDPALLRWTDEQLEYLKLMIEEFSTDYILQKLKKIYCAKKSKLYFVTKKDLWNVAAKYNLTPGIRHKDDLTSLLMRYEEGNPNDGIRVFKMPSDPSGKGFALVVITQLQVRWLEEYGNKGVSIDDTHNVTRYSLKLATLMVVDKHDRGLPAAFLLSGEMTWKEVKLLFDEVRKVVPDFAPKSLTSDEALAFYNGYKASFPASSTELIFCRFHILQSWKRKTKECIKPELQKSVNGALRNLLRISDKAAFHRRLSEILTYLQNKGCLHFLQYLQKEYLGEKIDRWAAFNRKGVVMSTSMYGERWHLRIKQEKLKRKANARADHVLELLIRAVNELAEDFEITDRRNLASSFREKENNVQHRLAIRLYKDRPQNICKVGDLAWNVEAPTLDGIFRVEFDATCSCSCEGNIHCVRCDVCPYTATCTCPTGALAGVACVHCHAVKAYGWIDERRIMRAHSITDEPNAGFYEGTSEQDSNLLSAPEEAPRIGDIRSQLHALRDDVAKIYTTIHAKVNVLVKQGDETALEKLGAIVEQMKLAAEVCADLNPKALQARPELSKHGATAKLQKARLYTRAKLRKQQRRSQSADDIRIDPEEVSMCALCFQEHPTLPEDMDPEEPDARETQWMRCTECRVWVHAVCGRGVPRRKCEACKMGYYSILV